MNQALMVNFEVEAGDSKITLSIPYGTELGKVYDACHKMLQEVLKQAQDATDKAKQKEQSEEVIAD